MRAFLLLVLSYLSSTVWAGGYAGCMERQLLWWAFEMDALNPPEEQTIGFYCTKPIKNSNTCPGVWRACRSKSGRQPPRCDFDELMHQVGNKPDLKWGKWLVNDQNGNLDSQASALKCIENYDGDPSKVENFKAEKSIKDSTEYNDMIDKLGQKFRDTWPRRAGNQAAFDNFDNALRGVITARTGDHGKFAIEDAKRILGNKMTVHERVVGTNPVDGSQWKTVDWHETKKQASANIYKPGLEIAAYYKRQYISATGPKIAKAHRQIIMSWKEAEKVSQSCRL